MRSNLRFYLILFSFALLAMTACQKEKPAETPSEPQGNVRADEAYIKYFGQPPLSDQGECFARVGFFPLRDDPNKVQPVPFFLFNQKNELPLIIERLINLPTTFPDYVPIFNPFPAGGKLRVGSRDDPLELDLVLSQEPSKDLLAPMAASLTETVCQLANIKRVRLYLNGSPWPDMPAEGFRHEADRIVAPGPPLPLLVVGHWEANSPGPDEILIDFDRPITVNNFELKDEAGQTIQGDYYTSGFDMAVVLHPQNPQDFKDGTKLQAEWKVTDRFGRVGQGSRVFQLRRYDQNAQQ